VRPSTGNWQGWPAWRDYHVRKDQISVTRCTVHRPHSLAERPPIFAIIEHFHRHPEVTRYGDDLVVFDLAVKRGPDNASPYAGRAFIICAVVAPAIYHDRNELGRSGGRSILGGDLSKLESGMRSAGNPKLYAIKIRDIDRYVPVQFSCGHFFDLRKSETASGRSGRMWPDETGIFFDLIRPLIKQVPRFFDILCGGLTFDKEIQIPSGSITAIGQKK
jgi:hypothetical protein